MRRLMKQWENEEEIQQFLTEQPLGFLGLAVDNEPYVVPLNYVYDNNAIYFHCASEGKKLNMIAANSRAVFTVATHDATLLSYVPGNIGSAYRSVMLFGTVQQVEELTEKTRVMQKMLQTFVPNFFDQPLAEQHVARYKSSLGSHLHMYVLRVEERTAKKEDVVEQNVYRDGMTVELFRSGKQ